MPYEISASIGLLARMAQGSATPAATPSTRQGGKPVPDAGNAVPQPESSPPPERAEVDLSRVAEVLDRFMNEFDRALTFSFDESLGRTVIVVTDPETGEVIRRIPPDEALEMFRAVQGASKRASLLDVVA